MDTSSQEALLLTGVGASTGLAQGPVHVVRDEGDHATFPDGGVLVAYSTDPTFLKVLLKASAVVTEVGGRLSHTAIVALELGIPCIVAARNACTLLKNGTEVLVKVDSQQGAIYLCEGSL